MLLWLVLELRAWPCDFTYTWHLKDTIRERTKLKQAHRYRGLTDGRQRGGALKDWVKRRRG